MTSRTNRKPFRSMLRKSALLVVGLMFAVAAMAQRAPHLTPGTYSVDELFREVSTVTGYRFAAGAQFDRTRTVRISSSPSSVKQILDLALAGSGYKYTIRDRYVMITADPKKKPEPVNRWGFDPWGPKIFYFIIDRTRLERSYKTNGPMLAGLDALLRDPDVWPDIDSVVITSAASPIGSEMHNAMLSIDRSEELVSYIRRFHPQVDRRTISTYPLGIDWEGFWALIETTPGVPYRDQILRLRGMDEDVVLQMLRHIGGRDTYNYLLKIIYPQLQYSAVRVVLRDGRSIPDCGSPLRIMVEQPVREQPRREQPRREQPPREQPKEQPVTIVERVVRDTVHIAREVPERVYVYRDDPEPDNRKRFYIALKNNILFDAALLPNLALEIPFGPNYGWSAEVEGQWSWWNTDRNSWWYHRVQMGGLEVRKWLGKRGERNPLTGWYVGVYGFGGTYDIRLFTKDNNGIGNLSNFSWSVGVSAGYALPVTRRLNMEFGLGVGYFGGIYDKYIRSSCEDVFARTVQGERYRRNWFGPTKAKVSLVWQIGSGYNRNYKKNK